jgi:chemotaxis signal transduction protein
MSAVERRYLIFALSGRFYAFDLAQVAEVSELRDTWPIPGAPVCYMGAINFHGSIVAVMDLAQFMGFPACRLPEKLVILDPVIAALAFQVERVLRIVPENQVEKLVETGEERFASSLLVLSEGRATLLDAEAIVGQATEEINI